MDKTTKVEMVAAEADERDGVGCAAPDTSAFDAGWDELAEDAHKYEGLHGVRNHWEAWRWMNTPCSQAIRWRFPHKVPEAFSDAVDADLGERIWNEMQRGNRPTWALWWSAEKIRQKAFRRLVRDMRKAEAIAHEQSQAAVSAGSTADLRAERLMAMAEQAAS